MNKLRTNTALGVITQNGRIEYATELDSDKFMGLAIGTPVTIKADPRRNLRHHKKFFALMKLGLEYWVPDIAYVSKAEYWIAHKVAQEFGNLSQNPDFYIQFGEEIASGIVQDVSKERQLRLNGDAQHNIELYRKKIMIDAGHFDYILLPEGGALREPHSIAFDKMSQDKFNEVYRDCFSQIWQQTFVGVFDTPEEAEEAVNKMMGFV